MTAGWSPELDGNIVELDHRSGRKVSDRRSVPEDNTEGDLGDRGAWLKLGILEEFVQVTELGHLPKAPRRSFSHRLTSLLHDPVCPAVFQLFQE